MEDLENGVDAPQGGQNAFAEWDNVTAGESVAQITATVEAVTVDALEVRLAAAEREIEELRASASRREPQGRRTQGIPAQDLLAKHGIGENDAGDLAAVDAALASLPVEQRLAVKSQLMRAGLLR